MVLPSRNLPAPAPQLCPGILCSRLGQGLHIILRHQAVEVCAGTIVSGAEVRDIHLIAVALSQ